MNYNKDMTPIIFTHNKTLYLFDRIAISFGGDCMTDNINFYGIAVYISVHRAIFLGISIDNVWNNNLPQEDFER